MTSIVEPKANDVLYWQWFELRRMTEMIIGAGANSAEERENQDLAQRYLLMLDYLRHDRALPSGKVVLGMYRAPASKDRHHDREGGLVAHLSEMWDWWVVLRESMLQRNLWHPQLTDQNALRAILHHDLNKVWRYKLVEAKCTCGEIMQVPSNEWSPDFKPCPRHSSPNGAWAVDYASSAEDRLDAMLGSVHKSLWIIQRNNIPLSPLLHNALLTSEGGYAGLRNKLPDTETVFAKIMYLCDELSANVLDRLTHGRFWDSKAGGMTNEGA